MEALNEVLAYVEERIDGGHIARAKKLIKDTLNYENKGMPALKCTFKNAKFEPYTYPDAFDDIGKMMYNELVSGNLFSTCNYVEARDCTLPMLRPDYGVSIVPSLFGLKYKIANGDKPWVEHAGTLDDVKAIIDAGVPDLRRGLGAKVFDAYDFYKQVLSEYPNCSEHIALYHPDLQGPFDVAHLIWGSDIYYALFDKTELVQSLLELVTQTYMEFLREIKKYIDDEDGGYVYQWGTLYKGGVVLRDDTAVNLSVDMYEEFVKPYDERVLEAFGGGSIHYCGHGLQWLSSMMGSRDMHTLNFGQPPNMVFGFDFLGKVYDEAKSRKISIADYTLDKNDVMKVKETGFDKGVTFSVGVNDMQEALDMQAAYYSL